MGDVSTEKQRQKIVIDLSDCEPHFDSEAEAALERVKQRQKKVKNEKRDNSEDPHFDSEAESALERAKQKRKKADNEEMKFNSSQNKERSPHLDNKRERKDEKHERYVRYNKDDEKKRNSMTEIDRK